jgi:hypothetical protein
VLGCYSQGLAQLSIYAPTVTPLLSQSYRDAEPDVALLANRQMTWGVSAVVMLTRVADWNLTHQ